MRRIIEIVYYHSHLWRVNQFQVLDTRWPLILGWQSKLQHSIRLVLQREKPVTQCVDGS